MKNHINPVSYSELGTWTTEERTDVHLTKVCRCSQWTAVTSRRHAVTRPLPAFPARSCHLVRLLGWLPALTTDSWLPGLGFELNLRLRSRRRGESDIPSISHNLLQMARWRLGCLTWSLKQTFDSNREKHHTTHMIRSKIGRINRFKCTSLRLRFPTEQKRLDCSH